MIKSALYNRGCSSVDPLFQIPYRPKADELSFSSSLSSSQEIVFEDKTIQSEKNNNNNTKSRNKNISNIGIPDFNGNSKLYPERMTKSSGFIDIVASKRNVRDLAMLNPIIMNHLVARSRDIDAQLERYIRQFNKYKNELEKIKAEEQRVEMRDAELNEIEANINLLEDRSNSVSKIQKARLEIERQNKYLEEIYDQLNNDLTRARRNYLDIKNMVISREREAEEKNNLANQLADRKVMLDKEDQECDEYEDKISELENDIQVARQYEIHVNKLRSLVRSLRESSNAREEEIISMEQKALNHKKEVEAFYERQADLERRSIALEEKKRKLMIKQNEIERRRAQNIKLKEEIRKKRDVVEREKDDLDQIEAKIVVLEEEIARKKRLCERNERLELFRKEQLENILMRHSTLEKEYADNMLKLRSNVDDYVLKFEGQTATIDQNISKLHESAEERRTSVELEHKKWTALYKEKHDLIDKYLLELRSKLRKLESEESLVVKVEKLSEDRNQLEDQVSKERDIIEGLSFDGIGSERVYLDKMEQDTRDERERIAKIEHELETRALEQTKEIERLDLVMEQLQMQKDEVKSEILMSKMKCDGETKLLTNYISLIPQLEKRLESLKQQRAEIEASISSDD